MLTIYIDFKSPASYLALEPTLAMARETGVAIHWRPFSVRVLSVPEDQGSESVGDRHRRVRAAAQRDIHLHYAAVQGLDMHFTKMPAGSDAALAALAAMEEDAVPFLRAAFAAYWMDQADLADQAVVERLLQSAGIDQPDWETAHEKAATIRSEAEELGIFEAPSYLLADQLFLGREHLPWIRSIITAEQGA